jgi:alkylation response protein AidB-like acyl-CoA dehydrogenase
MDMHHSQEAHAEIREEVRKLCARFPGEYWRELDTRRGYPTEFVKALTDAGWLAALIPEEFGGAGLQLSGAAAILEEIQSSGCNGAACHAQMYIMGTILRHGSPAQKAQYLPAIAGQITPGHGAAMARLLAELPAPVLAYCRSGARSTSLWQLARSQP